MDFDRLAAELIRDEGERLLVYVDSVGKLTIGIGHNLTDKGITQATSAFIFREDVAEALDGLDRAIPWWRTLSEVRQRVLVNMTFNLGIAGLMEFGPTLEHVRAGEYQQAAEHMLASKWARQVGIGTAEKPGRALRLANMMRLGVAQ